MLNFYMGIEVYYSTWYTAEIRSQENDVNLELQDLDIAATHPRISTFLYW